MVDRIEATVGRARSLLFCRVLLCGQVTKAFKYSDIVDVFLESHVLLRIRYSCDHDFLYETTVAPQVVQELRTRYITQALHYPLHVLWCRAVCWLRVVALVLLRLAVYRALNKKRVTLNVGLQVWRCPVVCRLLS